MSYEIRGHEVQKGKIRLINYIVLTYLFISSGKQIRCFTACYIYVLTLMCIVFQNKIQYSFMDTL